MNYRPRAVESRIRRALDRGKSILLLGPRQTGKTTLVSRLKTDLSISFLDPEIRLQYEQHPSLLKKQVEALSQNKNVRRPLVILDEIQKVPILMDAVQDLIDRRIAAFILTGSSVRKLRRGPNVNLLPGRVIYIRLDPFTLGEMPAPSLEDLLLYGSLPGVLQISDPQAREEELESYVTIYLEDEVRSEAIVRSLASFGRFLELAASESGKIVNFRKLSQEIGVAHTTIQSYYQILEDCLIAERVEPLTQSATRKKLTRSEKYLFFDLGVRRLAAKEGPRLPKETMAHLFEQWVGLELLRCARLQDSKISLRFWRDPDGPEVDWVIDRQHTYTPVEVKWTDSPRDSDIKCLKTFLKEYPDSKAGYLICRTSRPAKFADRIFALPWQEIEEILKP